VVHLPIGILLAAIVIQYLSLVKGFKKIRKAVKVLLLLGALSALVAMLTGLLHAQSGEFDTKLVERHRALGILVVILAVVAWLLHGQKMKEMRAGYFVVLFALAFLIIFTGHTGGTITHGEGFLNFPIDTEKAADNRTPIDEGKAKGLVYADFIAPILKKKCTGCHGTTKQKGKLRLDQPEYILKGGEDGNILDGGARGDMFRRLNLPLEDDDHMPPKAKAQLTSGEIRMIGLWLENGASFEATLADLPGADTILNADKLGNEILKPDLESETPIDQSDPAILKELRDAGVSVSYVSQGDGRISLTFVNVDSMKLAVALARLPQVHRQVVELKLPAKKLSHEQWSVLKSMPRLKRLSLDRSNFSDEEVQFLSTSSDLQYLNLVGTSITSAGLEKLELKNLKKLYLFNTKVKNTDLPRLRDLFPNAEIELGNYKVKTLATDTAIKK
jgi:uncharacterized membrane protein